MTQFDATDYFNRVTGNKSLAESAAETQDKYDALVSAKQRAVVALNAKAAGIEERRRQVEEASKNSWVTQQGIDPESVLGYATNLAASAYSGLSRQIGDVVGFAEGDLEAMLRTGGLTDAQISAVGRYRNGKATPEDMTLITARKNPGSYNAIENMDLADAARKRSALVNESFDQSGAVHTGRRQQLSEDLGANFQSAWDQVKQGASGVWNNHDLLGKDAGDLVSGLGKLIYNAGEAAVSNPGAAGEYMAENLPQLLTGAFGKAGKVALTATNVAYASENYQQGIANYQAKNGGALPPLEERQRMAGIAASLALAEHMGELGQIKAATGAAQAAKDTARIGLIQSLKNTGKAAASGFGEEALTEGYQTWGEGEVTGKPATAKDIYEGGVIGGLAGGGLSGGGRALGELTKSTPEHAATNAAQAAEFLARQEVQAKAIETGDVSALLDTKAKTYNPAHAIHALAGNSQLETATEETRKANLEKASEVVTQLMGERDSLRANTVDGIELNKQRLAEFERTGDTELADIIRADIEDAQKLSPKGLEQNRKALAKLDARLEQAQQAMGSFTADMAASAPETVINLSMASPKSLDADTALTLANDTANSLSNEQRTYLRAFNAARVAENQAKTLSKVWGEIFHGGGGNIGLSQYREQITAALASGKTDQAQQLLAQLNKFATDHQSKAEAAAAAWDEGKGTQIRRTASGWEVSPVRLPYAEVRRNGGLTLNTEALVKATAAESRAISAALSELQAAQGTQGAQVTQVPQAQPQEVPNVTHVSQSHDSTQDVRGGTQVQAVEGTGEAAGVSADGASAELSSGSQGDRGVSEPVRSAVDQQQTSVDAQPKTEKSTTQSNQDTEATASSQSPEETSSTVEKPKAPPAGGITAIQHKPTDTTSLGQRNPLADHLTQSENSQRPLVFVKDFLTALQEKTTSVGTFLAGMKLTDEQKDAVRAFVGKAKAWNKELLAGLPALKQGSREAFRFEDLMQYLMHEGTDGKATLDENVLTAISYAAFGWAADNGTKPRLLTKKQINGLLGRDNNKRVSARAYRALGHVGNYQHLIIDELGGKALQALGIKAGKSAPQELIPRLRVVLGSHALRLLEKEGLITRTTYSNDFMRELMTEGLSAEQAAKILNSKANAFATHEFFAIARAKDGNTVPGVVDIMQAVRGTQDVLGKLFAVESSVVMPSLEPIGFLDKLANNSNQLVSKALRKILLKNQSRPRVVRGDLLNALDEFSEEQQLEMMGAKHVDSPHVHLVNVRGMEAKNDALIREWNHLKNFVGEYLATAPEKLATKFYLPFSPWKNGRVGIASAINPQTSKIHRHLIISPDWETTIDPKNAEAMNSFWLRVAEGLGHKTERVDNTASIEKIQRTLEDPAYATAIDALVKKLVLKESLTEDEKAAVTGAVAKGGENMHTFNALAAVAYQRGAAGAPFKSYLIGEVDGVANGTMLQTVLLGARESLDSMKAFMEKGGFFTQDSAFKNFNQWRGSTDHANLDVYETLARRMYRALATATGSTDGVVRSADLRAIWNIAGEIFVPDHDAVTKDGRSMSKDAMNPLAFGSSVNAILDGMADSFLDSVYGRFEKLSKSGASQSEIDAVVDSLNSLLPEKQQIAYGKSIAWHMSRELGTAVETSLKKSFVESVGEVTKEVVKDEFATFLQRRTYLNGAAKASYRLYTQVYAAEREAFIEELLAKGEIRVDSKGNRISDLSPAQEAVLQARLAKLKPLMHTAMSMRGDTREAGLLMSKSDKAQMPDNSYENNTTFGQPMANGDKSVKLNAIGQVTSDPGVGVLSANTHALDSSISHDTQNERDVLNIHDAVAEGVTGLIEAAKLMNQNTFNALLNYSPLRQLYESMEAQVLHLAGLAERGELSAGGELAVRMLWWGNHGKDLTLLEELDNVLSEANAADRLRLEFLAEVQHVDQYAYEGGQYDVTDADRAKAKAQLADLKEAHSERLQEALQSLKARVESVASGAQTKTTPEPAWTTPVQDTQGETDGTPSPFDVADKPVKPSAFGPSGPGAVKAEPALVEFFNQNPNPTAGQLVAQLHSMLSSRTGRTAETYMQLLRLVNKVVDKSIPVQLVTPQTDVKDVLEAPKQPSVGWFVSKGGERRIHLLSAEFQNSGLTAEAVLHELIHGSLAEVVASELAKEAKNPKYRSEALELIQELEELRDLAKAYAKQNNITGFEEALGDVQEFITYGLTNQAFQRQVLSQVSMKSRTQGNSLVNGMKAFVQKVVGILFKGSSKDVQAQAINGMTVLVSNVSGLFAQAAQSKTETKDSINLSMAANTVLHDYTTMDIHQALDGTGLTAEFSSKLQDLLSGIVEKVHGPFGVLKAQAMKQQALTPQDVWAKAVSTGQAPFASSVLGSPLRATEQEAHALEQIEAVMRFALENPEAATTTAYRELDKLYAQAQKQITAADVGGQAAHDFLFKVELGAAGQSNHLARFAAYALAHQEFSGLMAKIVSIDPTTRTAKSFGERVQIFFEKVLSFIQEKTNGTFNGQAGNERVEQLLSRLVDIEAKRRLQLARPVAMASMLETKASQVMTAARDKAKAALNAKVVTSSSLAAVRATARAARLTLDGRLDALFEEIQGFNDKRFNSFNGTGMKLIDDLFEGGIQAGVGLMQQVRGPGKMLNLLSLASTRAQAIRKQTIDSTSKNARMAFINGGKNLDRKVKEAITQVFLRTGAHVLLGRFNMTEIEQLLNDPKALQQAIADTEAQLSSFGRVKDQYLHQANALGYFRVTGAAKTGVLMMNAHNIARLYGTVGAGKISEQMAQQAEKHIEQLVALRALSYVESNHLTAAKDVLRAELQRTDGLGNGVEYTMKLHKRFEEQSNSRLFQNQKALMMHGYTPEIYNPYIQHKVANETDGEALLLQGYKLVGPVERDSADSDTEQKFLYAVRDGGMGAYRSGITSLTGKSAKGTMEHNGYLNINSQTGLENASTNADILHGKNTGLAVGPVPDLRKVTKTHMVPVINPHGEIVNWRYMMQDKTKDSVMERDSSFDKVLGMLGGSIYDKPASLEVNTRTFEALRALDSAERHLFPDSYVLIGPRVGDPEMQQIWRMLPEDTRKVARSLWGREGMYVRKDMLTPVFGYRKFSLADALRKDPGQRTEWERVYGTVVEHSFMLYKRLTDPSASRQDAENYAKRAAVYVARGERVWQDIVREMKDIIVVKSVTVTVDNILSNISLLLAQGVPLKDVLQGHLVALRGARAYLADHDELVRLQSLVDTGMASNLAETNREILRLQDAINRNPVKELIDAGLMPSIVEDIEGDDDIYSYKSALARKTDKYTSKLPDFLKEAGKQVYMSRDTKAYQALSRLAQVSDFAGRYVLYKHLTERKVNPLDKESAVHEASESFINYDIPMPKWLQFTDDMGITMFTKYALRIQRVLAKLAVQQPARVLMMATVDQFANLGPIVLDSSWVHKLGRNPLNWGALQAPGAIDELATVHAAMALVR